MICKYCETDNPEGSVFCLHCGRRLDGKVFCPSCKSLCPEEALYCNACGARIAKPQPAAENEVAQPAQPARPEQPEPPQAAAAPKTSAVTFEKVKKIFELSGGICLMAALLFSLVFTFCIGLTATASGSSVSSNLSETTMMWRYFGDIYEELAESLENMTSYSSYFEVSAYLPIVLSTVICSATLVCVLVFTIIAAVNYGRHFKNPDIRYAKFGIAAVLSYVLGATAFLAVNSTSIGFSSLLKISVRFSDATIAGIVLSLAFLWLYCVSRAVMLGKELVQKRAIVDLVCTLAGILFAVLALSFTASPALIFKGTGSRANNLGLNFSNLNTMISSLFPAPAELNRALETNFTATYITSALAQGAQLALLVLAFVLIIKRAHGLGGDSQSCLGLSVALFAVALVQLALTCISIGFGNELITSADNYKNTEFAIGAATIVALIASAFALADSIVHKVFSRKLAAKE